MSDSRGQADVIALASTGELSIQREAPDNSNRSSFSDPTEEEEKYDLGNSGGVNSGAKLIPKRKKNQKCGSTLGPYIYLWPKDLGFIGFYVKDEEGIRAFREAFLKILIENKDECLVKDKYSSFSGDSNSLEQLVAHFICCEYDHIKKKAVPTDCARFLLAKLSEKGIHHSMVKIDLPLAKPLKKSIAIISYQGKGARHYTEFSCEALSEYFVKEEIAGNILGKSHLQKVELLLHENGVDTNTEPLLMYVLGIEMSLQVNDFSERFYARQGGSGQSDRIAVATSSLGRTFAVQAAGNDFDSFSSSGAPGSYLMADGDKFFASDDLSLANRTNSMLLVNEGDDGRGCSRFDSTSLFSRVQGLILLGKAYGHEFDPVVIAAYDQEFQSQFNSVIKVQDRLSYYRAQVEKDLSLKSNSDGAFKKTLQRVRRLASRSSAFVTKREEYHRSVIEKHLRSIENIDQRFKRGAELLLEKGKKFLTMTPAEIDIFEGLTKLAAGGDYLSSESYATGSDGNKIILNRLRLTTYDDQFIPQWNCKHTPEKTIFSLRNDEKVFARIESLLKDIDKDGVKMESNNGFLTVTVAADFVSEVQAALCDQALASYFQLTLAGTVPEDARLSQEIQIVDDHFNVPEEELDSEYKSDEDESEVVIKSERFEELGKENEKLSDELSKMREQALADQQQIQELKKRIKNEEFHHQKLIEKNTKAEKVVTLTDSTIQQNVILTKHLQATQIPTWKIVAAGVAAISGLAILSTGIGALIGVVVGVTTWAAVTLVVGGSLSAALGGADVYSAIQRNKETRKFIASLAKSEEVPSVCPEEEVLSPRVSPASSPMLSSRPSSPSAAGMFGLLNQQVTPALEVKGVTREVEKSSAFKLTGS